MGQSTGIGRAGGTGLPSGGTGLRSSGIGVLDKAVAVLSAAASAPATLADLVERTGLPRATAHRLAVALEGHRLVRRTDGGAWAPGPALAELGRGGPDLADLAGRHLVTLRDASGESAQFYVRDGAARV